MPPRLPLFGALRQPSALFAPQGAKLSTTAPVQALRNPAPKSSASTLLDMDEATTSTTEAASNMYRLLRAQRNFPPRGSDAPVEEQLKSFQDADAYSRMLTRQWKSGEVYSAHDLSGLEMHKWSRANRPAHDTVDALGVNMLDLYRNPTVVSEFISSHGRIKSRRMTGLSHVNHRKAAKAVRRAIGQGLHPSIHHHPEILLRGFVGRAHRPPPASAVNNPRSDTSFM